MNTEKKKIRYEFPEENDPTVEETFTRLPVLDLDLTKRYTFADYLTWMDYRLRELIDGFINIVRTPKRIHQAISSKLNYLFADFIYEHRGKCQIYHPPFAVRLPVDGSTEDDKIYNVLLPDICVVCDLSKLDDMGCIGAPDLIVEILSPSTARNDWNKKFNLYEKAGVREYWIVDPNAKTVHVFLLQEDGSYDFGSIYESPQKVPVHIFDGLEIDLKEVFED